ncbi:undecaprenyl-diphosphate phosphatase [Roseicyclus sp. F158]|uniref:Undecaprenyl-diphosphatase n=1 Tax=Tropicimonas omnivorans TaxID=3075590 RepID=A0ABU3DDF4_9RHOB|nr:undecaprenyl-diphosphate phosphatase [Roseicyclus sp. F158]MDT0681583.1 undecaprenyl-diphosphate phosphatase [Roseicyclus sp. F158]
MPLFHLLIVALIQGITEFLPVSSSGHLILLPRLTGLADQGQALDVAVHVGTLGAVILYFWKDVAAVLAGLPRLVRGRTDTYGSRMALLLIVATVPVILVGLFLSATGLDEALRSVAVIGWAMLLFGILLYWTDQTAPMTRSAEDWTIRGAVIMGLWQAVALIPGTSRSGITITGGRLLGMDRHGAAKIAMLMSIPTIIASGALVGAKALRHPAPGLWADAGIAALFAFLSALLALTLMMRLLRSVSFTPYVIYRCVLGVILIAVAYT